MRLGLAIFAVYLVLCGVTNAGYDPFVQQSKSSPFNPIHWWHLNETSGTAATDSGSGTPDTGTYQGGFTLQSDTYWKGESPDFAVALNGTTGDVQMGNSSAYMVPTTGGWSALIFANPTTVAAKRVMGMWDGALGQWEILFGGAGTLRAVVWDSSNSCNTGGIYATTNLVGSYSAGVWTMLVVTAVGNGSGGLSNWNFYQDGASIAAISSFTGTMCTTLGSKRLLVGASTGSFFGGTVDEPQIYNFTLSASQVAALYRAAKVGLFRTMVKAEPQTIGIPPPRWLREEDLVRMQIAMGMLQ